jgi:hypothetical protein
MCVIYKFDQTSLRDSAECNVCTRRSSSTYRHSRDADVRPTDESAVLKAVAERRPCVSLFPCARACGPVRSIRYIAHRSLCHLRFCFRIDVPEQETCSPMHRILDHLAPTTSLDHTITLSSHAKITSNSTSSIFKLFLSLIF